VGGSPLYSPIYNNIRVTNKELSSRLGRLAWKSIQTVVQFTEQKRMCNDPVYADAVKRLGVHRCLPEDILLFNSRVVNERNNDVHHNEQISMCTAIVYTNDVREYLNNQKAVCNTTYNNHENLVLSFANDTCSDITLSLADQQQLLSLNMSSIDNSLPAFISLYEGMPVIYRGKNLCPGLYLTKGAIGTVKKINSFVNSHRFTIVTSVLVHFPLSTIQLPHFPPGWFNIMSVQWKWKIPNFKLASGEIKSLTITRHQVPLQPGFAITGHVAQGKGIEKILTSLKETRSFASGYVAAS
jgi:hypothetical protein